MNKEEEVILAIEKEMLYDEKEKIEGVVTDKEVVLRIFERYNQHMFQVRRGDIEYNLDYIQPISYILIKKGDRYYTYERLVGGGNDKLYGLHSIGVGGHMKPSKQIEDFDALVEYNINKELKEEVYIASRESELTIYGLIIDSSNLTNSCHIAIVGIMEVSEDALITEKEVELLNGRWMTIKELEDESLESWTEILVEHFKKND